MKEKEQKISSFLAKTVLRECHISFLTRPHSMFSLWYGTSETGQDKQWQKVINMQIKGHPKTNNTSDKSKPYHISLSLSPSLPPSLSPHDNYDRGLPLSPCLVLVAGGIQREWFECWLSRQTQSCLHLGRPPLAQTHHNLSTAYHRNEQKKSIIILYNWTSESVIKSS